MKQHKPRSHQRAAVLALKETIFYKSGDQFTDWDISSKLGLSIEDVRTLMDEAVEAGDVRELPKKQSTKNPSRNFCRRMHPVHRRMIRKRDNEQLGITP